MKKKLLIFIFCFYILSPTTVKAADDWTFTDTSLQILLGAVTWVDYKQTLSFMDNEECRKVTHKKEYTYSEDGRHRQHRTECIKKYTETNSLLGTHPSKSEIRRHFLLGFAAHTLITHYLPQELRKYWQGSWIYIEADVINNNYELGFKIEF